MPANHIAKWNGTARSLSSLNNGAANGVDSQGFPSESFATVCSIKNIGTQLYVGGRFAHAGGVGSPNIAQWNLATPLWAWLGSFNKYHDGTTVSQHGIYGLYVMVTAIDPSGQVVALCDNKVQKSGTVNIAEYERLYSYNGTTFYSMNRYPNMRAVAVVGADVLAGHDALDYEPWMPLWEPVLARYSGVTELISGTWCLLDGGGTAVLPAGGDPWWPYPPPIPSGWKVIGNVNAILTHNGDTYFGGSFSAISGACPAMTVTDYRTIGNIFKWTSASGCPSVGWSTLQSQSGGCGPVGAIGANGAIYAMDVDFNACDGTFLGIWAGGNFSQAGGLAAANLACWDGHIWSALAAPNVSLTAPANGDVLESAANITINATATDGCSVSQVDFYQGGTLLGTVATAPYSFTWNSVPEGAYTLTAVATNSKGFATISSAVNILVVHAPPSIPLTTTPTYVTSGWSGQVPAGGRNQCDP